MILKKCILKANRCYKKGEKMTGGKPTGIVVHSTGANNKTLKRYVQPLKTDADYNTIIADLGVNKIGNHWNKSIGSKCMHAFIGENAAGKVETYQTLPYDFCCWGAGNGKKGSYNYNPQARIQFEICEDNLKDEKYFNAVFKEAAEFCAYICKTYGLGTDTISSHAEAHKEGYASNHADVDHWLKKFGKDMNWFRAEVDKLLNPVKDYYFVQVGAFSVKANAVAQYKKVKAAGFSAVLKYSSKRYRVQVGAFGNKSNAENMAAKLKKAGFSTYITKTGGTIVSVG